jgi:hypothetical protein
MLSDDQMIRLATRLGPATSLKLIYLFIYKLNFTINKTIEGTDNRTVESQIKSYLHITLTL